MADTVKTALLKVLEAQLLQGLSGVPTVLRDWQFPLDLGTLAMPALLFYEDLEDSQRAGRLMRNTIHLDLVLFNAFSEPVTDPDSPAWQAFKDVADQVAGAVHNLWYDRGVRGALAAAGFLDVEEVNNRKAMCNEDYGEMILTVRLKYGHALGDAFSLNIPN